MKIPKYHRDSELVQGIENGFGALKEGAYNVHTAFANPLYDKRSSDGLSGLKTVPVGKAFRVKRWTQEFESIKWDDVRIMTHGKQQVIHGTSSPVRGGSLGSLGSGNLGMLDRRRLFFVQLFLENVSKSETNLGALLDAPVGPLVALLYEQGTVSLSAVRNAQSALDMMTVPEWAAFRKRHDSK